MKKASAFLVLCLLLAVSARADKLINTDIRVAGFIDGASGATFPTIEGEKLYGYIIEATPAGSVRGFVFRDGDGNTLVKFIDNGINGDIQAASVTINGIPINIVSISLGQILAMHADGTLRPTDTIEISGSDTAPAFSQIKGGTQVQEATDTGSQIDIQPGPGIFMDTSGGVTTIGAHNQDDSGDPYTIVGTVLGVLDYGEILGILPFSRSVSFPANLAGSRVYAATAPLAAATLFLHFNDKPNDIWGVAEWPAGATEAVLLATPTTFTSVDSLMIKAPNPADVDLSTVGFNLKGVKQ
jgi:hypothetical protein